MWSVGQSKVSTVPVTCNVTVLLRLRSSLCSPKMHLYVPLFRLVAFLILSEKEVSLESSRDPPSSFGWDSTSRTCHAIPLLSPDIWKTQIYFFSWATVSYWVLGERVLKLAYGWKCRGWRGGNGEPSKHLIRSWSRSKSICFFCLNRCYIYK